MEQKKLAIYENRESIIENYMNNQLKYEFITTFVMYKSKLT